MPRQVELIVEFSPIGQCAGQIMAPAARHNLYRRYIYHTIKGLAAGQNARRLATTVRAHQQQSSRRFIGCLLPE